MTTADRTFVYDDPYTGDSVTLRIVTSRFAVGDAMAVNVVDADTGEPWARLSVNLPDEPALPEGAFWLKDWSENAAMAAQLVDDEVIVPIDPPRMAATGHVWAEAYRFAD